MAETSLLAQRLRLPCGAELPNRLAKAAMSEQLGDRNNAAGEALVRLYQRWSAGGAGLPITGNVMVDRSALSVPCDVVVEDERELPMLTRWAAAAKAAGARVWMQLNHPGRQSARGLSARPVAPSAVRLRIAPGVFSTPRALSEPEIEQLVERFARAAAIAKRAGFDGVEIHGAHGYLISQFLSPLANLRTDAWGGTAEKRRRFLLEALRAVRAAVGDAFPIGVKLNSADFQRGGFSETESMAVVCALVDEGLDLLEVSGGTYESAAMLGEARRTSTRQREAYFLAYAQAVRKIAPVPLMLTGGLRTARTMAALVADGSVDVIGLARPLALEPDLPARVLSGEAAGSGAVAHGIGMGRLLDGFVELMWYTQQLQRMGAGRDPDPARGAWRALAAALLQNGWASQRRKRGF